MYCGKCGKKNEEKAAFCAYCGAKLDLSKNKKSKGIIAFVIALVILIIILISGIIIGILNSNDVFFADDDDDRIASKRKDDDDDNVGTSKKSKVKKNSNNDEDDDNNDEPIKTGGAGSNSKSGSSSKRNDGVTEIEVDHKYRVNLKSAKEADELIVKDSVEQKDSTADEIKKIENRIINNYKVKAVNLGEMDVETAKGVEKSFQYIYNNYPSARNMLSNISIGNVDASMSGAIAYFGPLQFITPKSSSTGFPISMKTLMCLNSAYFLKPSKLKYAVKQSSSSGHFPKNSNEYAVVIHESGHFLTLVAIMKRYGLESLNYVEAKSSDKLEKVYADWCNGTESLSIAKEAYENYQKKYNDNIGFDEFRATISGYAMQKDSYGKYIYNETVAEAFHDYYINGEDAAKASIEIVNVLNERLK